MLIIDEISMVSSKLMDSIDKQCNVVKNLDDSSTAVFGGGQYHRKEPRSKNVFKVFDSSHQAGCDGITVIAGIAANIEELFNIDSCCGDSENIASHLGNGGIFRL